MTLMTAATTTERRAFARQLHAWGAAATAIRGGTKRPGHKWQRWQTQPQTRAEVDGLPWGSAAAVGVVNGSGGFRIFDIDAAKDADGRPVAPVPESIVVELLHALGLPDDYQWAYRSGSGAGWGVVVRCAEALPDEWAATKGVYVGRPLDGRPFGQLELRWATGQTVIDGAHPTGPGYQWRRGARPFVAPARRTAAEVAAAFMAIAERPTLPGAPSPSANGHGARSARGAAAPPMEKYGAAALADAIRQVSTAPAGERNNTLYRQTAALAELVNGGALTRPDVERAMTGAALATGLPGEEAAATISSAFAHVGTTARVPQLGHGGPPSANGSRAANDNGPAAGAVVQGDPSARAAVFKLDDIGNAERFVTQHGDDVRYDHTAARWLIWASTHWRRDDAGRVRELAKQTARRIFAEAAEAAASGQEARATVLSRWAGTSAGERRLGAMVNMAATDPAVAVTAAQLNRGGLLLNVQNGTINLATGELRPHDRGDLLTYVLPVAYDPAATCPTWDRFLARVAPGLGEFLARAVGYTLGGTAAEQCLLFLYGRGANGKTTFMETFAALMGDLAHKARAAALMADAAERIPNEVAALAGKRFVVASELVDGGRLNEGLVKDLTGNDAISARFLYGEPFTFRPSFVLWLYGNHRPVIVGTDDGIWRRVHLVPFTVQIPPAERDPALMAKLRTELPGILAWAMRGWQDYQRQGLGAPEAVTAATADYRAESDVLGHFIAERCVVGPATSARANELYSAYAEWATAGGLRPLSSVKFAAALAERGFTKGPRTNRGHVWQGVGLMAEGENG